MKRTLTAALAALCLAGCGGGDEDERKPSRGAERGGSEQPAERPAIAGFIKDADEICAKFNDRWVGVPEATPEYYEDWEETNEDLADLDVPGEISKEWDKFLAALDEQLRYTEEENGAELKEAYERKEDVAKEIGLADCSTG